MDRLLIASSPVEIEAKAAEAGLSREVHDAALALFHELTDRLGQAARLMPGQETGFPTNRFYVANSTNGELAALLEGLRRRPGFTELADTLPTAAGETTGLFASRSRDGLTGLLVKHDTHDGLPSPS